MKSSSSNAFGLFVVFLVVVGLAVILLQSSRSEDGVRQQQKKLVIPELPGYNGAVPVPGTMATPTLGSENERWLHEAFMRIVRAHPDEAVSRDLAFDIDHRVVTVKMVALPLEQEMGTTTDFFDKDGTYAITIEVNASSFTAALRTPFGSEIRRKYVEGTMALLAMQVVAINNMRDNVRVLGVAAMRGLTNEEKCLMIWNDTHEGLDAACAFFDQWQLKARSGFCSGQSINPVTFRESMFKSQCASTYRAYGY